MNRREAYAEVHALSHLARQRLIHNPSQVALQRLHSDKVNQVYNRGRTMLIDNRRIKFIPFLSLYRTRYLSPTLMAVALDWYNALPGDKMNYVNTVYVSPAKLFWSQVILRGHHMGEFELHEMEKRILGELFMWSHNNNPQLLIDYPW